MADSDTHHVAAVQCTVANNAGGLQSLQFGVALAFSHDFYAELRIPVQLTYPDKHISHIDVAIWRDDDLSCKLAVAAQSCSKEDPGLENMCEPLLRYLAERYLPGLGVLPEAIRFVRFQPTIE